MIPNRIGAAQAARGIDPWAATVGFTYVALAVTYTALALWRYAILRAGVDDGVFTQIANSAFHGFSSTVEGGANHFLVHFSPILFLAVPFVEAFRGAIGLIVLQAFLTAAVIFPVWGIARTRFPKHIAFAIVLVAACYPPLSGEAVGDFHELAFAPVLTAFLALAVDRRAWTGAILVAVALVCLKEDQFVSLAFIGGVIALAGRGDRDQRRCGLAILVLAIGVAALYFGVIRRVIDPNFPYWSLHFYQWWWNPPTPNGFVTWNSPARLGYMVGALAPLAFLPIASRYFIFAIPGLAEVLLSHEGITMFLGTHYSATWSGYMLCAFADGAYRLGKYSALAAKLALVFAIGISVWTSEYFSPIGPGYFLYRKPDLRDLARETTLHSLPLTASVWSADGIFAHFGMYPQASITRHGQDYLVFDLVQDVAPNQNDEIRGLEARGGYRVWANANGLLILKKSE